MGISGQTIWRQTGNFLRKQKIIRKITYYEPGFSMSFLLKKFKCYECLGISRVYSYDLLQTFLDMLSLLIAASEVNS